MMKMRLRLRSNLVGNIRPISARAVLFGVALVICFDKLRAGVDLKFRTLLSSRDFAAPFSFLYRRRYAGD